MVEVRRKTPHLAAETESSDPKIELGLNAAIVTVREQQPRILVVGPGTAGTGAWDALPFGTFAPRAHRTLEIGLREWVKRQTGLKLGFGIEGGWDEEKVLERYELLYEAGLMAEAMRDGRLAAQQWPELPELGRPMEFDHRRILATALGRLRGKLKYRPVVFELLPPEFTLLDLQKTVEAISGTLLHKQNFRRLVEQGGLVETTGNVSTETGGRPAKLYRFRREVVLERPAPGLRVKSGRA